MTIGEWIRQAKDRLQKIGVESASLETQLLAAHVLGVDRAFVLSHPDEDFPELAGEGVLARRESHEPLAYILGWREFYGRRFEVGPGVLIPRHETETLVEAAIAYLKRAGPRRVLDLGTGSGCIAITLKLECADLDVTAVDRSEAALDIASRNASDLGADVRFLPSDGFKGLDDERFDVIVTNPPYIGLSETLPAEIRGFEPHEALFSGPTGFEFYERLASEAPDHLLPAGRLMMEVGYRQAHEVSLIFETTGWYVEDVRRDLSGVERVVIAQLAFA